jgi:hypothetical protein
VDAGLTGIHGELREIRKELAMQSERLARVEERLPPALVRQ